MPTPELGIYQASLTQYGRRLRQLQQQLRPSAWCLPLTVSLRVALYLARSWPGVHVLLELGVL